MLASPALSVELYRYRGAAMDGGTLEFVFETDQQDVPKTATKEKVSFSDTVKGAIHQMFFVVVLPDGTVVEPSVEKRL
jgi:hypothetical protein